MMWGKKNEPERQWAFAWLGHMDLDGDCPGIWKIRPACFVVDDPEAHGMDGSEEVIWCPVCKAFHPMDPGSLHALDLFQRIDAGLNAVVFEMGMGK